MAVNPDAVTRKINIVVHRIVFGFALFLVAVVSVPAIWILLTEDSSEYSPLGMVGAVVFIWILAAIIYSIRPRV